MWRRVDLVWTDVSEERIASNQQEQVAADCSLCIKMDKNYAWATASIILWFA
jgi:hypothetical protein